MSDAKLVLDTNIVSYLMKGGALAEAYAPHVQGKLLAISFITGRSVHAACASRERFDDLF
ncbi:MAG: hypothetical protein ACHBNF_13095 [Chromatiales bacterium]